VSDAAAETGLALLVERADAYEEALRPFVGPTVARARVARLPPPGATLDGRRDHDHDVERDHDATVRIYAHPDQKLRTYHLEPVEATLDAGALATLADARDAIADGRVSGDRAAGRAVRRVAAEGDPVATLAAVLRKQTRGVGVLADFFADPGVSDVYASAPVDENRLRVVADGETMQTNVRLTADGAAALASRFRATSGRPFSRASPTLDAVADATVEGRTIRVAGVIDPLSDGPGFAFRAHDPEPWTVPALVANGTVPADAAALLSLAVERSAAVLVAGSRGAGKTTLLGALLWELPAETRTVVIEDTPELPVDPLQRHGRDVQALRTTAGDDVDVSPAEALRTALRLGEGALVLGEVRGEEARVLYEAMRVGASASAVLGTIHGDGARAVRERVVSDLGVPESSFAATDLLVTLAPVETDAGRTRRVTAIEEVRRGDDGVHFVPLHVLDGDRLEPTGPLRRADSRFVASLARPDETYADVGDALGARGTFLETLADQGRTDPAAVTTAHVRRRDDGHSPSEPC
jgi:type IV secretory pathway ATPase VirB11/archaellum biosynthesis ATPase